MANYNNLIADIEEHISSNGTQAINGAVMQVALKNMISKLGTAFQFGGQVQPADAFPFDADARIVFLACTPGTYTNFGGFTIAQGEVAILVYQGTWSKESVFTGSISMGTAEIEGSGIAFPVSSESLLVHVTDSANVWDYIVTCGDDYSNAKVAMLEDNGEAPVVEFYTYDGGSILAWSDSAARISVIPMSHAGGVELTDVADKSLAEDEIQVGLYVKKDLLDELLALKADIFGYYATLTAGSAINLEAASDVVDDSIEQTTGGVAEIANGYAKINEVKGKSQVWNQWLKEINSANYTVDGKVTLDGDKFLFTGTGSSYYQGISIASNARFQVIQGHKYYLSGFVSNNTISLDSENFGIGKAMNNFFWSFIITGASGRTGTIFTAPSTDTMAFVGFNNANGGNVPEGETCAVGDIQFIDLTLNGIDNLTTPEQVEAWLAKNKGLKPYYPYDAGSILNAKLIGLESYGRNLLNPSTNKARIIGRYSDTYGNYYGITGTYDSISFTSDFGETTAITPDSDGKFVLTEPGELSVVNPGADCAVFIWWDGKKTDYTPYKTDKAYIDLTHIYGKLNGTGELVQVFPDGGRGVNDVKDRLYVEDGEVKAKVVCGKVADLSQLNWYTSWYTEVSLYRIYIDLPSKAKGLKNLICGRYITGNGIGNGQVDISIVGNSNNNYIYIRDSRYASDGVSTLISSLAGVPLIYELATPLIYTDLVYQGSEHFEDGTPVQLPVDYDVDNYGMEAQILGSNAVPAELSIRYQMDAAEAIDTLQTEMAEVQEAIEPVNLISAASMDNLLATLGPVLNGTLSKTWNSTTGAYEFTFTPNE